MTHSISTPSFVCSFAFENSLTENKEGTVFILRFFSFLVPQGKGLALKYWWQHTIFLICPGIRQQRDNILPCVPYVGDNLKEKLKHKSK